LGKNKWRRRMPHKEIKDKIRGFLYGHAVGDALGLGTKFLSKNQVRSYYPHGGRR